MQHLMILFLLTLSLQALTTLMKNYPSQMGQWLAQILPPVWDTFMQSSQVYPFTIPSIMTAVWAYGDTVLSVKFL